MDGGVDQNNPENPMNGGNDDSPSFNKGVDVFDIEILL